MAMCQETDEEWEDFMAATGHPVTDWHKLRQTAAVLRAEADDLERLADEIQHRQAEK